MVPKSLLRPDEASHNPATDARSVAGRGRLVKEIEDNTAGERPRPDRADSESFQNRFGIAMLVI
jgi:hypothetical protein